MAEKTKSKSKVKHRLKFRFSIIFLSFLLSFMLCFIAYVKGIRNSQPVSHVLNSNVSGSDSSIVNSSQISNNKENSSSNQNSAGESTENSAEQNVSSSDSQSDDSPQDSSPSDESNSDPVQQNTSNPVPESQRKDDSYLNECVFVGDSISTGFSGYGFVSEKNVFAKTSMRIDLINNTPLETFYGDVLVIDALKEAKPANVYVMLGSNGMGWLATDKIITEYNLFIDSVKSALPDSNIYIMSIPPVTSEREAKPSVAEGKILNSDINDYNAMLMKLANEKGVLFIDVHSAVADSNGKLPSDVSTDGMHFIKETYTKIIEYILTHVAG